MGAWGHHMARTFILTSLKPVRCTMRQYCRQREAGRHTAATHTRCIVHTYAVIRCNLLRVCLCTVGAAGLQQCCNPPAGTCRAEAGLAHDGHVCMQACAQTCGLEHTPHCCAMTWAGWCVPTHTTHTFFAASLESCSDFAPVHTILPDAKMRAVVLGSRMRMITAAKRCRAHGTSRPHPAGRCEQGSSGRRAGGVLRPDVGSAHTPYSGRRPLDSGWHHG